MRLSGEVLSVLDGDHLSAPARLLSDAEVLAEFGTASLVVVLEDPSYLSSKRSVELKSRRDREKMAQAIFVQTAGANGYGSWAIVPHDGSTQLFVWAIDPSSPEWRRLNALSAIGVDIDRISSELISSREVFVESASDVVLRVNCTERCVQLALMLAGHWVFARRVDTQSGKVLEAIESTVKHLQAKGYVDDTRGISWQLSMLPDALNDVSALWLAEDALMSEPDLISESVIGSQANVEHCLNVIAKPPSRVAERRDLNIALAGLAVSLFMLASLVPFGVLGNVSLPVFKSPAVVDVPQKLLLRHWQLLGLQDHRIVTADTAAEASQILLAAIEQDKNVKLIEFSIESAAIYRLRGELLIDSKSPVERRRYLSVLGQQLSYLIPNYESKIQVNREYSIGDSRANSGFELLLEPRRVES